MKKRYFTINIGLLVVFILANNNCTRKTTETFAEKLEAFIIENCQNKKIEIGHTNVAVFLSPMDCDDCSSQLISSQFSDSITSIGKNCNNQINLLYIVTGDYSTKEKFNYVSKLNKSKLKLYIDMNNKLKDFLLTNEKLFLTPLLIIFNKAGEKMYQTNFALKEKDRNYRQTYNRIYEEIRSILCRN